MGSPLLRLPPIIDLIGEKAGGMPVLNGTAVWVAMYMVCMGQVCDMIMFHEFSLIYVSCIHARLRLRNTKDADFASFVQFPPSPSAPGPSHRASAYKNNPDLIVCLWHTWDKYFWSRWRWSCQSANSNATHLFNHPVSPVNHHPSTIHAASPDLTWPILPWNFLSERASLRSLWAASAFAGIRFVSVESTYSWIACLPQLL